MVCTECNCKNTAVNTSSLLLSSNPLHQESFGLLKIGIYMHQLELK